MKYTFAVHDSFSRSNGPGFGGRRFNVLCPNCGAEHVSLTEDQVKPEAQCSLCARQFRVVLPCESKTCGICAECFIAAGYRSDDPYILEQLLAFEAISEENR